MVASSAFALTGCWRLLPAPRGETAGAHWLAVRRRRRRGPGAAFPSSGRRHGAAAGRAGGLRAAVRAGRAAPRQPPAAARRLPRPPRQRHRARGRRPGAARRRLGLHRPAGAARPLHLPPRGVRGVRGAGGSRRERHGAAGAGPRLREVRRPGLRRGGPHPGAVPSAGRHRVRRAADLPAGQPALRQVHWTLLHHHAALLLFPGLLWSGSILPGPHRHRRGETADSGRAGDLVVCGSDPPHHRRADAQRRQQLVHRVLRAAEPKGLPASLQGWRQPLRFPCNITAHLCLAQMWIYRAVTIILVHSSVQSLDTKLFSVYFACLK